MTIVQDDILAVAQQVFDDEISGLNSVKNSLGDEFKHALDIMLSCRGKIIVSGMGKSGHIGNKIAATLASTGTPSFFMHPAEALHGDLGMVESSDVVIAISYSGESDELSAILPIIKKKNVPVIAITGNDKSSLAKMADCVLTVAIKKEACPLNLAPTTSTTATLVIGDALAVSLLSLRKFQPEDFAMSHPGGSLGRKLLTKVVDVMHTGERLPIVAPNAKLKEVVFEISHKRVGMVGVVDKDGKLLGIITDGDLRRILDRDQDLKQLLAQDFMTKNPKTILINQMAVDAVAIIEKFQIGGLLVVDEQNVLVGALNVHDLFKAKLI